MKLLTGNITLTGEVVWWGTEGWTPFLRDALPLEADAADALMKQQAIGETINDLAVIDAEATDVGPRPLHIRERIRGFGPTVRADLAVAQAEWR
ncbi:DUF2849 domain-containing protein [Sandaracinobacteroides saxicola]|uniref:DUF2849 domain-containing protein n=1 Tax=Sandaracinobacteroides saxicola TaxID=2759707 RepID=A0A7G5IHH4_9SPHN|nr:DUF2849 domain-containing protein [Sandaracinobacteroides saxicola]QMW22816.1 DUF2849 domain-containing protein [Sandaracinobacteroides saxicola]